MQPSLLYGSFLGLAQLVATLLVFAFGLQKSAEGLAKAQMPESLMGFILMMIVIGLAHRAAKTAALAQGKPGLDFGPAAKGAALTALIGGVVTGAGQWLYLAVINPDLRELQRAQIMERAGPELAKLTAAGDPDSLRQHAEVLKQIDYAVSPLARAIVYGFNTFFFATLLGIAFALIFRAAARRDEAASKRSRA